MSDDPFKLSDLKNPLYEYSQVATVHDLIQMYNNLSHLYDHLPWYGFLAKRDCRVAMQTVSILLAWLEQGKKGEV